MKQALFERIGAKNRRRQPALQSNRIFSATLAAVCCCVGVIGKPASADSRSGAEIGAALRQIAVDPEQTYRIRDIQLARGDIKIYLTEGVLSFVTPVSGKRIAAVFTTLGTEAGDGEIVVLPPVQSERASLASFTKTPNLDEHFSSAVFFFSDDTANELLSTIQSRPLRTAPEVANEMASSVNAGLRGVSSEIDVLLVQSLLDNHPAEQGFFYALIAGRELGNFDAVYEPTEFEPISVGRALSSAGGKPRFQLWTSFRPRRASPYVRPVPRLSDMRLDTSIHPDLSMSTKATFHLVADKTSGRVLPLFLSPRLKVTAATLDGSPVEIFQRDPGPLEELKKGGTVLLIAGAALSSGSEHQVELQYSGSVIRQTVDGYFVDDRNTWYPVSGPTLMNFDLTFHCPAQLRLVSTGEPVSDEVVGNERVVHRKTRFPQALAGFNLGDYTLAAEEHGVYSIECYANKLSSEIAADIPRQTADVLDYYTDRWIKLPIRSIAVTPIPGSFGQGFPGLIYLSSLSFLQEQNRPPQFRNPRLDSFYSALLLPHEVAHQWWGNIVTPSDYRANWIIEAMANYSALQFIERTRGTEAVHLLLDRYRDDLMQQENGKPVDSAGPVDFGIRLMDTASGFVWHVITYEKGTWILHMLRQRLGDGEFRKMQQALLKEFNSRPLSNEDFRRVASAFVPAEQPDRSLTRFFDTWVYGTGVPRIVPANSGNTGSIAVSNVGPDFVTDIPLTCGVNRPKPLWITVSEGTNPIRAPRSSTACELPSKYDYLYSQ